MRLQPPKSSFSLMLWQTFRLLHRNTSWSCKLWQNNGVLWKHPSFSENIWKLPISIIQTSDYSKGFLRSLALRIIEVWLYKEWYFMRICQQTVLMKYHALFVIFEKRQHLKLSSAANYRWGFRVNSGVEWKGNLWPVCDDIARHRLTLEARSRGSYTLNVWTK